VGQGTEERILSATVEVASIHGLGRLSVADVAKRAGLSRPTVYKHFATKDALVAAAVWRETAATVEAVTTTMAGIADPGEALAAGVVVALRRAREHPLLDRVVRTEPERLVPLLTSDDPRVLSVARAPIEAIVGDRLPSLDTMTRRRLADMIVRLLVSWSLSAPDDPPEVVASVVASLLLDGARSVAGSGAAVAVTFPVATAPHPDPGRDH